MASNTIIEFNGRAFDVKKGSYIKPSQKSDKSHHTTNHKQQSRPVSIDGFFKSSKTHATSHASKNHHTSHTTAKPLKHRSPAPHAAKHKPQRSAALIRTGLKPPVIKAGWKNNVTQFGEQKQATLAPKADPSRLARANRIKKSHLVSKFNPIANRSSLVKKVAHMPVVVPADNHDKAMTQIASPTSPIDLQQTFTNQLEKALSEATSHEAKPLKAPKSTSKLAKKLKMDKKGVRYAAAGLATFLVIGLFAYQNMGGIKMRIAASRASIQAELPAYKPSGFTLAAVSPQPGQVTANFRSTTDSRSFQLTQAKSSWNSEALLINFVVQNNHQYQTYQELGKTIYIYDGTNATWVDGGIWYRIEGDAKLTSDQLLRIARSL